MTTRSQKPAAHFHQFFNGWLLRQKNFRDQLRSNSDSLNDGELRDLVACVLAHYQQYYEEKSRLDVSLVFSPPWFSSFEQSFFWIAGFKPGLAFRIVNGSVGDTMSREQVDRMDQLRAETREEERRLEGELARIQENVAGPAVVEVTRRGAAAEEGEMEAAVEVLRGEMEVVVANADMLRTTTAERVVEILTPVQNVRFLAAVAELQLKIRNWGWEIEGESPR
ncbi:hypothetical protein SSX86_010363 [Deinandra increscens subsp. villosa]|uniref:DOG1 domain-containing protein n=1 Tax=Deinandra increscens subsp. villosa TaxID=3103831 RepID=A0AAP0DBN8_9ASTR